jgi:hypothetical protein
MRVTTYGRRVAAMVALGLAVLATACQPMPHPGAVVREPAGGPVSLLTISPNAQWAVVQASGAGATVPGPGYWRVSRVDGSVQQLPDRTPWMPGRISDDGRRVLYRENLGDLKVWDDGVVRSVPFGAELAADLRYGLQINVLSGAARRWEVATGAFTSVETGFPRPVGFEDASFDPGTYGVASDGNTAWFRLTGSGGCLTRVIRLAQAVVTDLPSCDDSTVSENGSFIVFGRDVWEGGTPFAEYAGPTRLELFNTLTGALVATAEPAIDDAWFSSVHLSPSGTTVWAVSSRLDLTAFEAVAAGIDGVDRFPVDATLITEAGFAAAASTNHDGRFFAYAPRIDGEPVRVIDRLHGTVEVLADLSAGAASVPLLSADGRLVAHGESQLNNPSTYFTNFSGWLEHTAAP